MGNEIQLTLYFIEIWFDAKFAETSIFVKQATQQSLSSVFWVLPPTNFPQTIHHFSPALEYY